MLSAEILDYIACHTQETFDLIETLCGIPAPSHHEEARARFCKEWLIAAGAETVSIDEANNVLLPIGCEGSDDITVFAAHTDTVFPDREPMPFRKEGDWLYAPGIADDTACLACLLMAAKYVLERKIKPTHGVLFAAVSCEEGLGDLKGTRRLMAEYGRRVKAFYAFDANTDYYIDRCVGSRRYELRFTTEGGHSFDDFGNRSAVFAMADFITRAYAQPLPAKEDAHTTFNVGIVEGGTSVNTIPESARCLYEYRSDDGECLAVMERQFRDLLDGVGDLAAVTVAPVGDRPCGSGYDEAVLSAMGKHAAEVCEQYSGLPCRPASGSTDCNIPMSMGIPAVCVGCRMGEGMHTRGERLLASSIPVGLKVVFHLVLEHFE